jgi:thioredoxin reductase/extradiol dioxygenase family protein
MNKVDYFTTIVGAGPAGLQIAYYLQKNNQPYVILEAADGAGARFREFPRHEILISINKVYTGTTDYEKHLRWDWNSLLHDEEDLAKLPLFKDYTGDYFPDRKYLVQYLEDYAKAFKLNIKYNAKVTNIAKNSDGQFVVTVNNNEKITSTTCVVCTGFYDTNSPNVPGMDLSEPYTTMNVDPKNFAGQEVLVVGKGNSGFETADNLVGTTSLIHIVSPEPVKFAWKTHYVGDLRAVNNNFLDTYQLKSQNAVLDATVTGIRRNADGKRLDVDLEYIHAQGEKETLTYDRVLNCTGFVFDNTIYDDSATPMTSYGDKFPKQTCNWESTNVDGLFFGGVLMHERDYKKHTSGFIHGWRYNCRILVKQMLKKYFDTPFPSYDIPATPKGLVDAVIARVNRSSAMWQQFGFIGDVIVVDQKTNTAKYLEEFTMQQVNVKTGFIKHNHYYTVTLEFNKVCGDPFAINRQPNPENADTSIFLHPVIRQYNNGRVINTIHILEDLYTNWTHPTQHVAPLRAFFEACFKGQKNFRYMPMKSMM